MLRLIVYLLLVSAFLPISKGFTASSLISFPQTSLPHRRVPTFSVASKSQRSKISNPFLLTTTAGSDHDDVVVRLSPLARAAGKFRARPLTYLTIPIIAAGVGWFTNWLAVQMIFYPIHFMGIPLYRRPEMPLGLLGWQGIIPCKTRPMTIALVDMVTSQLLTVPEAFARLDPKTVAKLLAPEVPKMTREIIHDIVPSYLQALPEAVYAGFDRVSKGIVLHLNTKFLERLTVGLQQNADSVFSLRDCVVDQMMMNRAKLGELFRKCGQAELDFLTNSGLWFGFLLGIIQMAVALFWDNPWSLSIGGGIVGLATNWLALKWIFEPVNPVQLGPFLLQGKFLRRQKEVAAEFSKYFANNILTGEQMWKSILTNPETKPAFAAVFAEHFESFVGRITRGFRMSLESETMASITKRAIDKLPNHVPVLFPYMDQALALEQTLRIKMEQMTALKFERVLHPIFEEDELTLILAGAVLGFMAGLVQQGLETGRIKFPNVWTPIKRGTKNVMARIRQRLSSRNNGSGYEGSPTNATDDGSTS